MKMQVLAQLSIAAFLVGCASQPKMAEVAAGASSVQFYQHGREPISYRLGVVDGKSFWGGGGSAGVDAANNTAGPMAGLVVAAVSDISNKAAEAEQVKAADLLKSMSGNLSYVDELSAKVMPLMATKLGTVYDPGKLQVLEADVPIEGDGGYFEVTDLHADLVVVVEVSKLVLTEKPSAGGMLKAAFTAGFNDKTVTPQAEANIFVYKRDTDDGKLKRAWKERCIAPVLMVPGGVPYSELVESPEKGHEMFHSARDVLLKNCVNKIDSAG